MHEVPGTLTLLLSTRNNGVILLYPIKQKVFDKNNSGITLVMIIKVLLRVILRWIKAGFILHEMQDTIAFRL